MIIDRVKGDTSQFVPLQCNDSAGDGVTGMTNATSNLKAFYYRQNGTGETEITMVAAGTLGTWASGTLQQVDATNMPGLYVLGVPDAALASGADWVVIGLQEVGSTALDLRSTVRTLVRLTGVDMDNASTGGITNLGSLGSRPGN